MSGHQLGVDIPMVVTIGAVVALLAVVTTVAVSGRVRRHATRRRPPSSSAEGDNPQRLFELFGPAAGSQATTSPPSNEGGDIVAGTTDRGAGIHGRVRRERICFVTGLEPSTCRCPQHRSERGEHL